MVKHLRDYEVSEGVSMRIMAHTYCSRAGNIKGDDEGELWASEAQVGVNLTVSNRILESPMTNRLPWCA